MNSQEDFRIQEFLDMIAPSVTKSNTHHFIYYNILNVLDTKLKKGKKAGASLFENTPVIFEKNWYEVIFKGSNLYSMLKKPDVIYETERQKAKVKNPEKAYAMRL